MFDPMPDSLTYTGSHTVNANGVCAPNTCPVAALSASPTSGNAPLNVNFNGTGSSDSNPGDTIASYTFNFGDGSGAVTCPGNASCTGTGTTSHTYNAPGDYNATLTVVDSRGLVSCNTAGEVITVTQSGVLTNYALTSNGGTATGSTEYYTGGMPAVGAINGDRTGGNWGGGSGGWNDNTRDLQPDSLEVAFSGARTISEIRLYTLQDNFSNAQQPTPAMTCAVYGNLNFDVQYWNGTAWVTVPSGSVTNNDKVERVFTFPAVTTTKIRVVVNAVRAHYSRIVELEAYGAPGQ
jgi:PKD repeat protein